MKRYFKAVFTAVFTVFLSFTNLTAQTENVGTKTKIRVGVASVKTVSVGEGMDAQQFGSSAQNSLNSYLNSPEIEVVVLESKLASQIPNEAKSNGEDIFTSLIEQMAQDTVDAANGKTVQTATAEK